MAHSRAGVIAVLAALVAGAVAMSTGTAAASSACVSGGSGFTATVCITNPADGTTVTGGVPVEVTVDITGSSTGVARVNTYLDGAWLLEDVSAPYSFVIPGDRFLDGTHVLSASATLRNGYRSARAEVLVDLANGVTTPPVNTATFSPRTASPDSGTPLVFAATGDGAGGRPEADAVVSLVQGWNPDLFAYLGDVYSKGTPTEFHNWYGHDGSRWHALHAITNPVIGNHEYEDGAAPGYFDYWDNVPDHYSYDSAGWHFIALNSTSQFGQVGPGTPQYEWLLADLAASESDCTIAYFHHPVVSAGPQNDRPAINDIWRALVDGGADIVLTGHDHQYQRYVPLDGELRPTPDGTTQFVVGGGGHGIQALVESDPRLAAYSDTASEAFGALRLELNSGGANFAYVNKDGTTLDSGVIGCGTGDTSPPSDPDQVGASAQSHHQAEVSWAGSADDVGVAGYTITRDGAPLVDVGPAPTSYVDATAVPEATHVYGVQAFDGAGNRSALVEAAPVTMPATPSTIVYDVSADAYVNEGAPASNYGASSVLRVDQSPVTRGYLRFDVGGLPGPPTTATLRVRANSNQLDGYSVATADSSWSEATVTYANAPPIGPTVATSGPVASGAWTEVRLPPSSFDAGNGTYTLVLEARSTTAISMASKEDVSGDVPQLLLGTDAPDPPVAADVDLAATEDAAASWTPTVSGASPLTCAIATPPQHGTAAVAPDCSGGTYTPTADHNGGDAFTYEVSDGALIDEGTVSVTIAPVNDPPVVSLAGSASATAGVATAVPVTVSDVDGDCPLTLAVVEPPSHGTATEPEAGTCTGGSATGSVTYTSEPGYTGEDRFSIVASDPGSATSAAASVELEVGAAEPVQTYTAVADNYVRATAPTNDHGTATALRVDGSPRTESLLRFDVNGVRGEVTSATLRIYAQSSHRQGFDVADVSDQGWDETTTYDSRPPTGAVLASSGPTTSGSHVEIDLTGHVTGNGVVDLALLPVDNTALAVSSREGTAPPELIVDTRDTTDDRAPTAGPVSLTVTENGGTSPWTPVVSDPDGATGLTCSIAVGPTNGTATVGEDCSGGTYTPDVDFDGSDPFSYRVSDGSRSAEATVSVTVTARQTTLTFSATEDAYVTSGSSGSNFGTSSLLRVDGAPETRSYLRFDVAGLTGPVVSATLRVMVMSTSAAGVAVHAGSEGWSEGDVTFSNAPAPGPLLTTSGPVSSGQWVELPVTDVVGGSGPLTLVLNPLNNTNLPFASRETATPPQLVIETG